MLVWNNIGFRTEGGIDGSHPAKGVDQQMQLVIAVATNGESLTFASHRVLKPFFAVSAIFGSSWHRSGTWTTLE